MKTLELHLPDDYPERQLKQLELELNDVLQSTSRFAIVACPTRLTESQWHALRLDIGGLIKKAVG